MKIPIIIVCYNNYQYVENTIRQILNINAELESKIIILNNSSTEKRTIKFLENSKLCIWNVENNGPWINSQKNVYLYDKLPEKYILTDPDLEFSVNLPPNFVEILSNLSDELQCFKIGFKLKRDIENMFPFKEFHESVNMPEEQIQHPNYEIYNSYIDTTFALYNKKYSNQITEYIAITVAGNFTCRHLPWYPNDNIISLEDKWQYFMKNNSISSVSNYFLRFINENYVRVVFNEIVSFSSKDSFMDSFKFRFFYGIDDNKIDVTMTTLNYFMTDYMILIPANDALRAEILGDPCFLISKTFFIYDDNALIKSFDSNEEICFHVIIDNISSNWKEFSNNFKSSFYYGIDSNQINVTNKVLSNFFTNNVITISNNDVERADNLGDPCFLTEKSIFLYYEKRLIKTWSAQENILVLISCKNKFENYFCVSKRGQSFFVDLEFNKIFWTRHYEKGWEEQNFIIYDEYISPELDFIDIGGWNGCTSLYVAQKSRKVISIEADQLALKEFKNNIKINKQNNIYIIEKAIFRISNSIINFGRNSADSNSKWGDSTSQIHDSIHYKDDISIITISLEDILNIQGEPDKISLIKIDIEGGEEYILQQILDFDYVNRYVSFHYDWWKNKNLDRFIKLTNEQKDQIRRDPFCSLLFSKKTL